MSESPASAARRLLTPELPELPNVGSYLREQREHAKLSLRQLAELAGVSNPYLSQVERGLRRPSAEVLAQIARGLQISAEAVYVRAGILEPAVKETPQVETAIAADPRLTARQRNMLLDLYRTFIETAGNPPKQATARKTAPKTSPKKTTVKKAAAKKTASATTRPSPNKE